MKNTPTVTTDQMQEVDRIMVDEIGVSILMMMENASRNIAILARKMLGGSVKGKNIVILCGKGNNGGDGLGAGRHLINFGADVKILLSVPPQELGKDAKVQHKVLENLQPPVFARNISSYGDLIIDALLGYNLDGNPREPIATIIKSANASGVPILAVDIPSGLQGDTGEPLPPTIKAHTTLTLALPKVGLTLKKAKEYVGELYLADLSVPKTVYEKIGINNIPVIFEKEEVVKIF